MPATPRTPRKRTGSSPYPARVTPARRRLAFPSASPAYSGRSARVLNNRVGFPPSMVTPYNRATVEVWGDSSSIINGKQLVINELTQIPRKTGVEINGRERDVINCHGFTFRTTLRICLVRGTRVFAWLLCHRSIVTRLLPLSFYAVMVINVEKR